MVTPWAPWVVIALVIGAAIVGWTTARKRKVRRERQNIANSEYLYNLPSFKRRLAWHRLAAISLAALAGITTIATALMSGMPVDRHLTDEKLATRDIILCLDVSGSMIDYDSAVMDVYVDLLPSFQGERVGLVIWNATARTIFPLTDDYAMVKDELERGARITKAYSGWGIGVDPTELYEWMEGTFPPNATGSSLIADGLASCVMGFDQADEERSRTIILATDNEAFGDTVFTLEEAADFAQSRNVSIYGLYASSVPLGRYRDEYEKVVLDRGGLFYDLSDPKAADAIIDGINAQQAIDLDATPKVVETDRPDRYYPLLLIMTSFFILGAWGWRS